MNFWSALTPLTKVCKTPHFRCLEQIVENVLTYWSIINYWPTRHNAQSLAVCHSQYSQWCWLGWLKMEKWKIIFFRCTVHLFIFIVRIMVIHVETAALFGLVLGDTQKPCSCLRCLFCWELSCGPWNREKDRPIGLFSNSPTPNLFFSQPGCCFHYIVNFKAQPLIM